MKVILGKKAIKQGGKSFIYLLHIYYGSPAEKVQPGPPGTSSKASVRIARFTAREDMLALCAGRGLLPPMCPRSPRGSQGNTWQGRDSASAVKMDLLH